MQNLLETFQKTNEKFKSLSTKLLLEIQDPASLIELIRQKPNVLVIGEFNAGKSSLINSALGENLLPTGVTPTTAILTKLEHGPFQIRIKALGEKEAVKLDPGKSDRAGFGMPDEKFDWQSFRNLITDPTKLEKIERIEIAHPSVPSGFNLIDSPGINDLSKSRAEIVYDMIPSAELIIFVISALKPFSESERIFIEEKLLSGDLKKIVFVLNRLDEIDESERQELLTETKTAIVEAINKSYANINTILESNFHEKITDVEIFGTCAKVQTPITGEVHSKSIGFATKTDNEKTEKLAAGNRDLWKYISNYCVLERKVQAEKILRNFHQKNLFRIERTIKGIENSRSSNINHGQKVFKDSAEKLKKLRDSLKRAEIRIQQTEDELKKILFTKIDVVMANLTFLNRLSRDPGEVNSRLKELYEYITNKMKSTFDLLYSELGKDFQAIIDDREMLEERKLEIEYDLTNLPSKIVFSLNFAYLAAIFFGVNLGLLAGGLYFASQIISNQRSIKDYFLTATVPDEIILQLKEKTKLTVCQEIEYAIDFVRQSLIHKIEIVQNEIKNLLLNINRPLPFEFPEIKKEIQDLRTEVESEVVSEL
ncbi:MAG: dynamin family protein [Candidatus Riflebacteria bacterium]|nr:dynamin family protein [Candidatus Riflebacteria bacterium]